MVGGLAPDSERQPYDRRGNRRNLDGQLLGEQLSDEVSAVRAEPRVAGGGRLLFPIEFAKCPTEVIKRVKFTPVSSLPFRQPARAGAGQNCGMPEHGAPEHDRF